MYIGPWQEYRLAKFHDEAIQRLRQEWESQLQSHLVTKEEIRVLQPVVAATLPSLLLPVKSRTNGLENLNGCLVKLKRDIQSKSDGRCSSRLRSIVSSASLKSNASSTSMRKAAQDGQKVAVSNNQGGHEELASKKEVFKSFKAKKKGKKAPLTALEQVQKRKKMFATWIKRANDGKRDTDVDSASTIGPKTSLETKDSSIRTRLPVVPSIDPMTAATRIKSFSPLKLPPLNVVPSIDPMTAATRIKSFSPLKLPPLNELNEVKVSSEAQKVNQYAAMTSPSFYDADIALDESVDEIEVNKLLDWTDTLLSPQSMESLCNLDDKEVDM